MELLLAIVGLIIGSLITWLAAMHYYEKASRDLVQEADELKRLSTLMLRGMENAGWTNLARDSEGNIKGMVQTFSADVQAGPATIGGTVRTEKPTEGNK